jgi:glycosyltransferase involved in cell wall biosynthesis
MKVLMLSRASLYTAPGGDTVQIESTAKYLRKNGIEIDIRLADDYSIDYNRYDLLHLFNVIRPNDFLYHVSKSGKPFVLSTIYVDYSEFEQRYRRGILRIVSKLFDKYKVEYLKTIARSIKSKEKIVSFQYIFWGQKRSMKKLLLGAACLLPNSFSEMKRIERDLGIKKKYKVIPNAVDKDKFKPEKSDIRREGVICVARIEGLKNQLNLIKAMKGLDMHLTVIGKPSPNHREYFNACRSMAGPNVSFMDHIAQDKLRQIYAKAKVHILPSWFETTGLSSLEAAYMGSNIVVTAKGDTTEYFGQYATYCDPNDVESIRNALIKAYNLSSSNELQAKIEDNYVWEVTAAKTIEAYKEALSKLVGS